MRAKYTHEQRALLGKPNHTDSLYDRLDMKTSPCPNTGCWWFTGSAVVRGYGYIMHEGRNLRVHRVSYERHKGPIPEGLTIDHLCRNTLCINPAHLEAVTMAENNRRSDGITSQNARKTHCVRGHNEWAKGDGRRRCKACDRAIAKRMRDARAI